MRLPKTKGVVIRGEFIMPKAVFDQKYKTETANPRNMVAGLINSKTIRQTIHDVNFVAYEVIKPVMKPSEQMDYLKTLSVDRVLYQIRDTLTNESLSALLVEWRQNYMYEIDGVIVANDAVYPRRNANPEHAFAFKMVLSDQVAEAKVVDVIWNASKDGYLKPRVRIEPLHLGGVTIEYATGFNAAFIKDNGIGIGATIELIRSGDVIPYIKSVIVPAPEPKMPSVPFKWNDTHVDIMLTNMEEDPTVKEKNITGFFRGINVEGLSSGNIMRLISAGYDTVPEIIGMSKDDFLSVDGFKEKMADKLYSGIRDKLEQASIVTLMAASNVFGRGFSEKRLELIMSEVPDILVSDDTEQEKINTVSEIKGMGTKSAEAFVEKIDDFVEFLEECGLEDKLYEEVKQPTAKQLQHPLNGKTVVLTGTRDKSIIEFLKSVGATQGSSVSKNTSLVVAKDPEDATGKVLEARKLGIPIMSVEQFITQYL
jgi:DNA ligase (NAD+)